MVDAAREGGKLLLVGQVLPFFPEFRWVRETVESGQYGKLRAAAFRRVIAEPNWSAGMNDFRKLGGRGIDLHIHDNHSHRPLVRRAEAGLLAGLLIDGLVNHVCTQYLYDDRDLTVSAISQGIAAAGLKFAHSFEIFLERATLQYDAGTYGDSWTVNRPLTLITSDGQVTMPSPGEGTEVVRAFTDELQAAVNSVRTGVPAPVLSGELAYNALRLCHAEAESIATGSRRRSDAGPLIYACPGVRARARPCRRGSACSNPTCDGSRGQGGHPSPPEASSMRNCGTQRTSPLCNRR